MSSRKADKKRGVKMAKQPEKNQDKIDVLYQWLTYELQQARDTLLTEVRMSSAQIGSLYGELKSESEQSMKAVSQEIRSSYKQNQTIYDGLHGFQIPADILLIRSLQRLHNQNLHMLFTLL